MIQRVIDRLAGNSAQIKSWTIAVLAALLLFSQSAIVGSDRSYVGVGMIVLALVFWGLDGYYLYQERLFRRLYDETRQRSPNEIDYSMDTSNYRTHGLRKHIRLLKSISLFPFYAALTLACVAYLIVSLSQG